VDFQSRIVVALMILMVALWILRNVARHKLGSGQALFWLTLLAGAGVLAVAPSLVDRLSVLWGNLVPVSWISFVGIVSLIVYLLHQSTVINAQDARILQLVRSQTFLEQRVRTVEAATTVETPSTVAGRAELVTGSADR
jgi:hypothetical protein